jgi:regulator of sigma E protease
VESVPGTFFGVPPWKRIAVAFAGPLCNFIFAVLVLSVIWGRGFEVETLENRIVLLADIDGGSYPSDQGGLQSGDRIVEIRGRPVSNYRDIQENIALNPGEDLSVTAIRDGENLRLTVRPKLNSDGAAKIGVYPWTPPEVRAVRPGSPSDRAGLRAGDRITAVNGESLPYTAAFTRIFRSSQPGRFPVAYERNGVEETAELEDVEYSRGIPDLGIEYPVIRYRTEALSIPRALATGSAEAARTFAVSVKGLSLLFKKEIDLTQAVSGPARITYMVGDIAAEGFGESIGTGFGMALNFLALISIALCLMNLLPLPILDGGMIVLYLVEIFRRRPLHPRAVSAFQTAGTVIIFGLMLFAMFNDILFFTGR